MEIRRATFFILGVFVAGTTAVPCVVRYTDWDTAGNPPGPIYLDRQHPKCQGMEVLNAIQLETRSMIHGKQIRYRYRCCSTGAVCISSLHHTSWEYEGRGQNGETPKLARHNIDCRSSQGGIRSLHLTRDPHYRLRYNYQCCENYRSRPKCFPMSTAFDEGNEQVIYLDRHNVQCPYDSILSRVQLHSHGKEYRYDYSCCIQCQV